MSYRLHRVRFHDGPVMADSFRFPSSAKLSADQSFLARCRPCARSGGQSVLDIGRLSADHLYSAHRFFISMRNLAIAFVVTPGACSGHFFI
jgi:hypothetical protein